MVDSTRILKLQTLAFWLISASLVHGVQVDLVSVDGSGVPLDGLDSGSSETGPVSNPVNNDGDVTFATTTFNPTNPGQLYLNPRLFSETSRTSAEWYISDFTIGFDGIRTFAWAQTSASLFFTMDRKTSSPPTSEEYEGSCSLGGAADFLVSSGLPGSQAIDVSSDGDIAVLSLYDAGEGGRVAFTNHAEAGRPATLLTQASSGAAAVSGDGSTIAFWERDNGDYYLFLYDVVSGETTQVGYLGANVTLLDGERLACDLSDDGRVVVFESKHAGYWNGTGTSAYFQVVVYDLDTETYTLCSRSDEVVGGANQSCKRPRVSADGRHVVFRSSATDLGESTLEGGQFHEGIFCFDRLKKRLFLVSKNSAGSHADEDCEAPALSPDGRFVTFVSGADNLVAGGERPDLHVFRVDLGPVIENQEVAVAAGGTVPLQPFFTGRVAGTGERVFSVDQLPSRGTLRTAQGTLIADDGTTYPASTLPWSYEAPAASGVITFDVFATDSRTRSLPARVTVRVVEPGVGLLERLSVTPAGMANNGGGGLLQFSETSASISKDGQLVSFSTIASLWGTDVDEKKFDVYLRDRRVPTTRQISLEAGENATLPTISGDGTFIYYFRRDNGGELVRKSLAGGSAQVLDAVSVSPATPAAATADDGSICAYINEDHQATLWLENPEDESAIQVISLGLDGTTPANEDCRSVELSGNGQVAAFTSSATNLVAGVTPADEMLFARSLVDEQTLLASLDGTGTPLEGVDSPALSRNGRFVAFIAGPDRRVFVRDLFAGNTFFESTRTNVENVVINADGTFVAYRVRVNDAGDYDASGIFQVYRQDLASITRGTELLVSNAGEGIQADGQCGAPDMSASGRYVSFPSLANNLVGETGDQDMDIFLNDLGTVERTLPALTAGNVTVNEGEAKSIDLTFAESAIDLTVEIVDQPGEAAADLTILPPTLLNPFWRVVYEAQSGFSGADSFSYRIGDSQGWSDKHIVGVTVQRLLEQTAYVRLAPDETEGQLVTGFDTVSPSGDNGFGQGGIAVTPNGQDTTGWFFRIHTFPTLGGELYADGSLLTGASEIPVGEPIIYKPVPGAVGIDTYWLELTNTDASFSALRQIKVFLPEFPVVLHLEYGWNALAFPGAHPDAAAWPVGTMLGELEAGIVIPQAHVFRRHVWQVAADVSAGEGFLVFCTAAEGYDWDVGTALAVGTVESIGKPGWYLRGGLGHQASSHIPEIGDEVLVWLYGIDYGLGQLFSLQVGMGFGESFWLRVNAPTTVDLSLNTVETGE